MKAIKMVWETHKDMIGIVAGLAAALMAITLGAAVGPAGAQSADGYPSKPIRVIVATSPGGTSDIFIRALGDEYHRRHGQPFVVENRSGGGMNIGGKACADAPNDGYTICILPNETLALNQFLYKKLNYDPAADYKPITNPFFNTQVIAASSTLGVNSLDELATASKKTPGKMSYSSLSLPMQMFMEDWKKRSGADIVSVPVRGGNDTVNNVLSATTPVGISGVPNWLQHVRSGSVVPLAVNSLERSPLMPQVPTLAELGYKDEVQMYFGIVAPAGTPDAIVQKLYATMKAIGDEPVFRQKRMIEQGLVPVFDRPEHFSEYLKAERVRTERQFKQSGLEQR